MTRFASRTLLLLALLAFALPSMAQDALDKRVTLDLKDMAPRDAFGVISTAIGYTVDVAPQVSTPVDILVRNISARTALNTICESIGCTWQASGTLIRVRQIALVGVRPQGATDRAQTPRTSGRAGGTIAITRPSVTATELARHFAQVLPADMKFENASLAEVAERLSKATGLHVTFSGNVRPDQTFTADLGNRTFPSALTIIGEQFDSSLICRVEMPSESSGRTTPSIAIELRSVRKK
jgi:type II secretory pathway component GspD/PulD (secretin)